MVIRYQGWLYWSYYKTKEYYKETYQGNKLCCRGNMVSLV